MVFLLADTRVVVLSAFTAPASRGKVSSSDQAPRILTAEQWGLGYFPGSGWPSGLQFWNKMQLRALGGEQQAGGKAAGWVTRVGVCSPPLKGLEHRV